MSSKNLNHCSWPSILFKASVVIHIVLSIFIYPVYAIRNPTACEACKLLSREFLEMMEETSSSSVIETGHRIGKDKPKQKKKYSTSEVRLIEIVEGVCRRIRAYKVRHEFDENSSLRYQREESETMKEIKNLRKRGVEVRAGLDWQAYDRDVPDEVAKLQRKCDAIVEDYEEVINNWFFENADTHLEKGNTDKSFLDYVCRERILSRSEHWCLEEPYEAEAPKKDVTEDDLSDLGSKIHPSPVTNEEL